MNINVKSYNRSEDRKGNTFLRLTASSSTPGDPDSPYIAIAELRFYDLSGVDITSNAISLNISSEDSEHSAMQAVDGETNTYFSTAGNNPGEKWIELVFPGDQKISGYKVSGPVNQNISGADLKNWRVERLKEMDPAWQILDARVTGNYYRDFSGKLQAIYVDITGRSVPPVNYTPPAPDYAGTLPAIPANIRATATSETAITVRWIGNPADTRSTSFSVYRKLKGEPGYGNVVATVNPIYSGQIPGKAKNITSFADKVQESTPPATYVYSIVAHNNVGDSDYSKEVDVTLLTKEEVYLSDIEDKIYAGVPIHLDQAFSHVLGDSARGSRAAAMAANGQGTVNAYKASGFTTGEAIQMARISLTQPNTSAMLVRRYDDAIRMITSNSAISAAFMAWAVPLASGGRINLAPADILKAADTAVEQQEIVDWAVANGYLPKI